MKLYDPIKYWSQRVEPNTATPEVTDKHIKYIKSKIGTGGIILDYGPGAGRIFPAYKVCLKVYGSDVTDLKQDIAEATALELGIDYHPSVRDSIKTGYKEIKFDTVVACSVFLHQRPEDIEEIIEHLGSIGKRVVFITWYDDRRDFDVRTSVQHCYNPDYFGILDKLGFKYDYVRDGNQLYCEYWRE